MKDQVNLPLIPLRDIVVYPSMVAPLFVGRNKSVSALEMAMSGDKKVVLLAQKNAEVDDPEFKDLYKIGTVASILQLLKLPDGTVKALVEGLDRVKVNKIIEESGHHKAFVDPLPDSDKDDKIELTALVRSVSEQFSTYVKLNKKISSDVLSAMNEGEHASKLSDTISSHLNIKVADKQKLLEEISVVSRLEKILGIIESELGVMKVEKKIRSRVKLQMEKTQKEYYLNEQMKAIQKELSDGDGADEVAEYEEKINKTKFSKEALEKAKSELKKLKSMGPMSAESAVVRNYLDWLISLPWKKNTKIKSDIVKAEHILNEDHYGLEKVKERVLEYLAVQHRSKKLRGPIICLVGAPGVGKTSLGKSLARATGRNFVRISLGGFRD